MKTIQLILCLSCVLTFSFSLASSFQEELGEDLKITSKETKTIDGIEVVTEKYSDEKGPYAEIRTESRKATISRITLSKNKISTLYSIDINNKRIYSEMDMNQDGKTDYIRITLSDGRNLIIKDSKFSGTFDKLSN